MDRILVLEDELALRNSLCRSLRQNQELAICETGSLRDAVRLLDENPQLIVSDLDLPDGSGLDLLQELAFRGLHVPVIFITAYLSRYRAELPVSSNIDVLEKPFGHDDLSRLIRRRLDRHSSAPPRSAFSVADYLQLAGLARRDVCLTIAGEHGTRGKIIVQDGQTAWAEDQLGEGIEAFRRLAFLPQAEVNCRPSSARVLTPNVQGSLEQLLLDAARQLDEEGGGPEVTFEMVPASQPAPSSRVDSGKAPPLTPPRPVQKEKQVNKPKPLEMTNRLDKLISPQVKGAARAERDGSVLEYAGELDAESSCAVATVASRQVEELAAELGLGDVLSWHASMGKSSWYVVHSQDQMLVAVGGANKNPSSTLGKVEESNGRRS
jgi:DNA-binding response OmpR family regulator